MLRWSGTETGIPINLAGIVDPAVDIGPPGSRELAALGRSAASRRPDPSHAAAVAATLGPPAAADAAAVAGAFELYNRVVDGTGLPVGRAQRQQLADIVEVLNLDRMPHA